MDSAQNIDWSMVAAGLVIAVLVGLFLFRRQSSPAEVSDQQVEPEALEQEQDGRAEEELGVADADEESGRDVAAMIEEATSLRSLLGVASKLYFNEATSVAFMAKLLQYEEGLDALDVDDWQNVYSSAEQGSELQKFAHQRLRAKWDEDLDDDIDNDLDDDEDD